MAKPMTNEQLKKLLIVWKLSDDDAFALEKANDIIPELLRRLGLAGEALGACHWSDNRAKEARALCRIAMKGTDDA